MRQARESAGWLGKQVAQAYGCDPTYISRVERGERPASRGLVRFYETTFEQMGQLESLHEAALHPNEGRPRGEDLLWQPPAITGDASKFVRDTIPSGTLMAPGQQFIKSWTIRNVGAVPWVDRRLERVGPLGGLGLITSERHYPIRDTKPGSQVTIKALLTAPTYDGSSIAYFKMVDVKRRFCFPDNYPIGLDVSILVRGQRPDEPPQTDPDIPFEP